MKSRVRLVKQQDGDRRHSGKSDVKGNKERVSAPGKSDSRLLLSAIGKMGVEDILLLQKTVGNRAVSTILTHPIQASLKVTSPDDPAELEAEKIAAAVMEMTDQGKEIPRTMHQADSGGNSLPIAKSIEREVAGLEGTGNSLPESEKEFFESRMGYDFSSVKVHVGGKAEGLAKSLQARAFTYGQHIVFGPGEYHPGTTEGRRLLAHELAHVVQQNTAPHFLQGKRKVTTYDFKEGPTIEAVTPRVAMRAIRQYNDMIQTTLTNLRDAWQDGINNFQTEMQFPSAGEAMPDIASALLTAASNELFGKLMGVAGKLPGVGEVIGPVVSVVQAVNSEIERAKKAAQSMALGAFIVNMRDSVGNRINDLRTQRVNRENALWKDFVENYHGMERDERFQFFKNATKRLSALKIHSEPITRSLGVAWIRENFRQGFGPLAHWITEGVIEIKYEVYRESGMRIYSFKYARVVAPQGGRIAKLINRTFGGRPIDVGALRCKKRIILEKIDKGLVWDTAESEEVLLDENNFLVKGTWEAFRLYQNMPRRLRVGRLEE